MEQPLAQEENLYSESWAHVNKKVASWRTNVTVQTSPFSILTDDKQTDCPVSKHWTEIYSSSFQVQVRFFESLFDVEQ